MGFKEPKSSGSKVEKNLADVVGWSGCCWVAVKINPWLIVGGLGWSLGLDWLAIRRNAVGRNMAAAVFDLNWFLICKNFGLIAVGNYCEISF